ERDRVGAGSESAAQGSVYLARSVSVGRSRGPPWLRPAAQEGFGGNGCARQSCGSDARGDSRRAWHGAQAHCRTGTQDRSATGGPRFFSASLAAGQGSTPAERRAWRDGVYEVIQAMTASLPQGALRIERMCVLSGVSRAGYYRHWAVSAPRAEET